LEGLAAGRTQAEDRGPHVQGRLQLGQLVRRDRLHFEVHPPGRPAQVIAAGAERHRPKPRPERRPSGEPAEAVEKPHADVLEDLFGRQPADPEGPGDDGEHVGGVAIDDLVPRALVSRQGAGDKLVVGDVFECVIPPSPRHGASLPPVAQAEPVGESALGGVHAHLRAALRSRRRRRSKGSAWEGLDRELNPSNFRPRLAADVEFRAFTRRSGERYTMIKTPRGPAYVRLTDEERSIVEQMDGSRSVKEIVVADFRRTGTFSL